MRGYSAIGLDNAKDSANVGSALRAAGIFGAAFVAVSGPRYHGSPTDTMKAYRRIPLFKVPDIHEIIPHDCVSVAVELVPGAIPLHEYHHPERAFYIFGAEDNTLGDRVLGWCRDVVYIPTAACLNLAACVNVVLYDRMAKRGEAAVPAKFDRKAA